MQDTICGHPKALAMRSMNSFLEQVTIPRACIALKMAMKASKTSSVTTCCSSFLCSFMVVLVQKEPQRGHKKMT